MDKDTNLHNIETSYKIHKKRNISSGKEPRTSSS